jgi:hypothetical protein
VILILIVALEKIDGRYTMQIIFKMVGRKEGVVRNEDNRMKDERAI